jgi:endonuclease/exonuclease/phosphatase family metal-dependent hydrolase
LGEIEQILRAVGRDIAHGLSVVVLGDLNHEPDTPEYAAWAAAGVKDVFGGPAVEGLETWPTGQPEQRIDYIWVGGPLAERTIHPRVLFEGAFRRNPDDPGSFGLSDHLPVLAAFSGESVSS